MNVAQFLSFRLGKVLGSGGKVEGKEINKLDILKQVNTVEGRNKGKDFKETLFAMLSDFLSGQINEFQDIILHNLKKLQLSDSESQIILKAIENLKTLSQTSKIFQFVDLILSIPTNIEVKKTLLENLEIAHELFKKLKNEGDPKLVLERISDIFKKSDTNEIAQKDFKEIPQMGLNNFSLKTSKNNSEILISSSEKKFFLTNANDFSKNDPNKINKNIDTFVRTNSFSENNTKNLKQATNMVQHSVYTETTKNLSDDKKVVIRKERVSTTSKQVLSNPLNHFKGNDSNVSKISMQGSNISTVAKNQITPPLDSNTAKVSPKIIINKNIAVNMNNIMNLGSTNITNSTINDISKNIEMISEVERTLLKNVAISPRFKFKVIAFEKVNNYSTVNQERNTENIIKNFKIEKSINTLNINKKFQINIAQKKYESSRLDVSKDFNVLLKENTKTSQKNISSNNIPVKAEKALETLNRKSLDNSNNNMNNQSNDEGLRLKNSFEYFVKTMEINKNFSKELTNVIEQMIQKDSGSTNIPKTQVEIQKVVVKLHPPELGDMEITLVKNGKNIELRLSVISETVKDTVEKNLGHLDQRLREIGFNLEKFSLEVRTQDLKTMENHPEDSQHNGKNYQESQRQNQDHNHNQNKYNQGRNDSLEFFDEIFEKEVIGSDEQRV